MSGDDRLEVKASAIHGLGLFARVRIDRREKLGELTGSLISIPEARRRARELNCIAIVEFEDGRALDASMGGNHFTHVNHSCTPNTYMRRVNHRVEFYSLRSIAPGEELTCDYGETHHDGMLPCRCGSARCRRNL
jgi:SET domain-containing protein